jgi:hypothetical protein
MDLAYMVTTFQIAAISIACLRDKREKPLVPPFVSWWGWVTVASFFPVNLIPFMSTGPFAWNGSFNFWIAFFTWFIWCPLLSTYIIKGIGRIKAEDEAAGITTEDEVGTVRSVVPPVEGSLVERESAGAHHPPEPVR